MDFLDDYSQCQFIIHELVLPYCTVCTPAGNITGAWHTPLLCVESSDAEYSLFFAKNNIPFVDPPSQAITGQSRLNSQIHRCVSSETVTSTKIKMGKGMASRGTMSLTMTDKIGDPGPIEFSDHGTLFGKLIARNVLDGKKIISHYYSVGNSGVPVKTGETIHFITRAVLSAGQFSISAKDALKDLEAFSNQYPSVSEVYLTADIDDTQTVIPISDGTYLSENDRFIIDKEIFWVESISGNDVTVKPRGTGLSDGTRIIYKTYTDSHTEDSTVQEAVLYNGTSLANALLIIIVESGLGAYEDYTAWEEEISQWDGDAFLYGLITEPSDVSDVIDDLLSYFLVDMWLDQDTQKIKISANRGWKDSSISFSEGNDIQKYSVNIDENSRYSRAYVMIGKAYQAESDEVASYSRAISDSDIQSEDSDFYGSVSLNEIGYAPLLSSASARRLTARTIQRYSQPPRMVTFEAEERKLVGVDVASVVDIYSRDKQSPGGEVLTSPDRVQITKIQPLLNQIGRKYKVDAVAYVPLYVTDPGEEQYKIYTNSAIRGINLASEVDAPASTALNYTFVFDNCTIGSAEEAGGWLSAITAGTWESGSRIRIILIDTVFSSKGGGVYGSSVIGGADCYNSNGITSEIYVNYDIDGYTANGELIASGGAGGGAKIIGYYGDDNDNDITSEILPCGGGGNGIPSGVGGSTFSEGPRNTIIEVADGTEFDGGYGGYVFTRSSTTSTENVVVTGGVGGSSGDGADAVVTYQNMFSPDITMYPPTAGGYAVTGGNITVYNDGATTDFRRGQSIEGVDYTLVTV